MTCYNCALAGHCRKSIFVALTKKDLENSDLIRAVRNTGHRYFRWNGIMPAGVIEFLDNENSRIFEAIENGENVAQIVNGAWQQTFVDTEAYRPPQNIIGDEELENWYETFRSWTRRTWFQTVPYNIIPRVSEEYEDAFLAMTNLIGAFNTIGESINWPRNWAGNQNNPFFKSCNDN